MKKRLDQSGFHLIMIPLLVIVLGIIGFAGWYVWNANRGTNKTLDSVSTNNPTKVTPTPTPTAIASDWLVYTDTSRKISFEYPKDSTVTPSSNPTIDMITINGPNNKYHLDIKYYMGDKGGWVAERKITYSFSVSGNRLVLSSKQGDHLLTSKERESLSAPGGYNATVIEGYYIQARPLEYSAADATNHLVADIVLQGVPASEGDAATAIFEHVVNSISLTK